MSRAKKRERWTLQKWRESDEVYFSWPCQGCCWSGRGTQRNCAQQSGHQLRNRSEQHRLAQVASLLARRVHWTCCQACYNYDVQTRQQLMMLHGDWEGVGNYEAAHNWIQSNDTLNVLTVIVSPFTFATGGRARRVENVCRASKIDDLSLKTGKQPFLRHVFSVVRNLSFWMIHSNVLFASLVLPFKVGDFFFFSCLCSVLPSAFLCFRSMFV